MKALYNKMVNNRFSDLDLIRALAIFSVIEGHFFMNTGFQNVEFGGVSMFVQGGERVS